MAKSQKVVVCWHKVTFTLDFNDFLALIGLREFDLPVDKIFGSLRQIYFMLEFLPLL